MLLHVLIKSNVLHHVGKLVFDKDHCVQFDIRSV